MAAGDSSLLIIVLSRANEKPARRMLFIQQFWVFVFYKSILQTIYKNHFWVFSDIISTNIPGILAHLTDEETDSGRVTSQSQCSTKLEFELGPVWLSTPSFNDIILLRLCKNSLTLLGPSTSWSPAFQHVNQT